MAVLQWDKTGERFYQTGIDRGVLYLTDGRSAVWNGLISVEETPELEVKTYYLDGVKYLATPIPGDFQGKLKAYTYPDLFDVVNGIGVPGSGLFLYDQTPKSFNMSYRTRLGTDLATDHSYRIHILYNLIATPDAYVFETLGDKDVSPVTFGWSLVGLPQRAGNYRPTAHISIDSFSIPTPVLTALENILYGTADTDPRCPSIAEVAALLGGYLGALLIVDNKDGTWTAIDDSNTYITMLDETTFQIANAVATYVDATTYVLTTTTGDSGGGGGDGGGGDGGGGGEPPVDPPPTWDGRPALGTDFVITGAGTDIRATLDPYQTAANQFAYANPDNVVDQRIRCRAPFGGKTGTQVITLSSHNPDYQSVNFGQNTSPAVAAVTPKMIGNHAAGADNWEHYIGFSVLFPGPGNSRGDNPFPSSVPTFFQFHEIYSVPWTPSPPWQLGVRDIGGGNGNRIIVPSTFAPGYPRFWESQDFLTEHWYQFVIHLGMSSNASADNGKTGGFLELWVDGNRQTWHTNANWQTANNDQTLITPTAIAGMGTNLAQVYFDIYRSACQFAGEGTSDAPLDGPDDPIRLHFHGMRIGPTYGSVTN